MHGFKCLLGDAREQVLWYPDVIGHDLEVFEEYATGAGFIRIRGAVHPPVVEDIRHVRAVCFAHYKTKIHSARNNNK